MRNSFTEESRELFFWTNTCWWCGRSHANCLHHILGRVSSSPLNAAPINNFECHIGNGKLNLFDTEKDLLNKTLKFLLESDYTLTKEDNFFKEKYKKYYNDK